MTKIKKSLDITRNIIFCVSMALVFLLSLWKCHYGFQEGDEPFYFTISERLLQGDALFKDEWHLSQLSAVLRIPFIYLYMLIFRSTDGILLAMRIVYLCCHTAVGILAYCRLKRYGYATIIAVLLYYLFELYPLCTFSYNATAMDSLVIAGTLLATEERQRKIPLLFSGVFLSFAVLSCPYIAIVYVVYVVFVLVRYFLDKAKVRTFHSTVIFTYLFERKTFCWITAGTVGCAIVFLTFVFVKAGTAGFLNNFPSVLFGDPEHIQSSFIQKIIDYFLAILFCCGYIYFCFFAYFLTVLAMLFDKQRNRHRAVYFSVSAVITLVTFILMYPHLIGMYFTAVMLPIMFMGLTSYLLCEHKPKPLFYCIFVSGLLYSFAVHFSSNQLYTVIFMAMAVSDIAGIIFIFLFLQELLAEKENSVSFRRAGQRVCLWFCVLALCVQSLFQFSIKVNHFPYGNERSNMICKIEKGPAKGIHTSLAERRDYDTFYENLSYYQNKKPGRIVIVDIRTWGYLYLYAFPCGSYSSWASGIRESSYQRLQEYYRLNPENKADYIYLPEYAVSALGITDITKECQHYGYSMEKHNGIYYLEKIRP